MNVFTAPSYDEKQKQYNDWINNKFDNWYLKSFKLRHDGMYDFHGNINLSGSHVKSFEYFKRKIHTLHGNLQCNRTGLVTLKGMPKIIKGNLEVCNNNLTKFDNPEITVYKIFDFSENKIQSFKNIPICLHTVCGKNNKLKSLLHCPSNLKFLNIRSNPLITLQHIPENVKVINITECLKTIKYFSKQIVNLNSTADIPLYIKVYNMNVDKGYELQMYLCYDNDNKVYIFRTKKYFFGQKGDYL